MNIILASVILLWCRAFGEALPQAMWKPLWSSGRIWPALAQSGQPACIRAR